MATKRGSKPGSLHKHNRTVAPNQRRIVFYPHRKPPIAYTVMANGIIVHNNPLWGKGVKKALLSAGYTLHMRGGSVYVFEKFFEVGQ